MFTSEIENSSKLVMLNNPIESYQEYASQHTTGTTTPEKPGKEITEENSQDKWHA